MLAAFEKIRNSLKYHVLHPSHYLSAPILNMAKVKLELISDAGVYLFFEKAIGGIVSYICQRCFKANNTCLKSYDPMQESKHIIYLDANNLRGYTMSKFLPKGGFKSLDRKEFDLNRDSKNNSKGCLLEVDLQYLKE